MSITTRTILFFLSLLLGTFISNAQVTSPSSDNEGVTDFGDQYYIFCAGGANEARGALLAETPFGVNSIFTWEKYDSIANIFVFYDIGTQNDTLQSLKSNLTDGCYRVTIEADGGSTTLQAWILHNWINVTYTEIPDSSSNCEEFQIWADYEFAPLTIYNTSTNARQSVRNPNIDFTFRWYQSDELVSSALSPIIYPPIASESLVQYNLVIQDQFNCTGEGSVDYDSKVTEAGFVYDPIEGGEAVLEVTFTNNSINYDSAVWFFYKDSYVYSLELEEAGNEPVDSIDFFLVEDTPIHLFERSGEYRIKLVTVNVNSTGNCYDTLYMSPGAFIKVDTSLVDVPNVFTPNGDGMNDVFVVRSQSLKSMSIKIYNRWGGLVHSWKYTNISSKDYTYEHSVWDGRIGSRMASPGVYYYAISYEGRDIDRNDKKGRPKTDTVHGFFHLFRDKN